MWDSIMAVNSFFVWPVTFIFLLYSVGRAALFFEWKLFLVAVVLFGMSTLAQIVIGILSD
jgi:hypothetical protein